MALTRDFVSARPNARTRALAPAHPRETVLVRLGLAASGLYLLDDAFLHREAGVAAVDHLVSGTVPLGVLALVAVTYPRLRAGLRAWLVLTFGLLTIGVGLAVPVAHTLGDGPAGDDYTGLVATFAGLPLVVSGLATLWQTRRLDERRHRRYARRFLLGVVALLVLIVFIAPVGFAYRATHVPRSAVRQVDLGAVYQEVTFTTGDGLRLTGWYVPSRNRAAVIAFPGRSGPVDQARMLVRHGYGVLLFDPRGRGESEGDPNAFGWGGELDLLAAIAYLQRRPDVDPERIGGLGLSVGGELLLQTAAETDALKAVVAEGAGVRSFREQFELPGTGKWFQLPIWLTMTSATAVFANGSPPPSLVDLVARIAPRPVFLIYATHGQGGEELNPTYYAAAGEPKELWEIPDADHTGGIDARPEEYERRVVAFFDRALLTSTAGNAPELGHTG